MLKEIKADDNSYKILVEWKKADPTKWTAIQKVIDNIEDYINDSNRLEKLVSLGDSSAGAKSELLPCPFCGEYPKIGSLGGDNENWAIWCECQIPCAETGLSGNTKEEIIDAWNKRKR